MEAKWSLRSVTQESDLESFLNNAQLAGTEFTAERNNLHIVKANPIKNVNPFLLSKQDEIKAMELHLLHSDKLRVPRRPDWAGLGKEELVLKENEAFLDWRRKLAEYVHFYYNPTKDY